MEIQTRRQILETWRATIDYSFKKGEWKWGGRSGRNSISDAEQLLTILYPATTVDSLKVDAVDQTADDVLEYLRPLGNALDIPRRLVTYVGDYMRTYQVDGAPDFSGGTYFETEDPETGEVQAEQGRLHVVDSYSMSITLCLATLGFLRIYRRSLRSQRMLDEVDELARLSNQRLTAAMVGLLRSFTVNTFDPGDQAGQVLCQMINQSGVANEVLVRDLLEDLQEIRAALRQELTIGLGQVGDELDNRGRLFECGWSWGVVDGAPEVEYVSGVGKQPEGVAEPRPYLYFTVVALDGIQDLFSERTRILGLLDEEQQRLSRALQLRWELTSQFWARVSTFGSGTQWPLEDLPWRTTDGRENDYYSVLLTSIVVEGIGAERITDIDIERIGRLLEELSNRGRITRRPMENDPSVSLHVPGMSLRLIGTEKVAEGPRLQWTVSSFSVLLLKRLLRVAELLDDTTARIRFLDLADKIWLHVEKRRIDAAGARGLWDEPTQVFESDLEPYGEPSWFHTERVMEVLVQAAAVTGALPAAADSLTASARQLLAEAEHLFDQERLRGTSDTGEKMRESFQVISAKLRRAREVLRDRPGTAGVLASDVLRELDTLDGARRDTTRMT